MCAGKVSPSEERRVTSQSSRFCFLFQRSRASVFCSNFFLTYGRGEENHACAFTVILISALLFYNILKPDCDTHEHYFTKHFNAIPISTQVHVEDIELTIVKAHKLIFPLRSCHVNFLNRNWRDFVLLDNCIPNPKLKPHLRIHRRASFIKCDYNYIYFFKKNLMASKRVNCQYAYLNRMFLIL